MSVQSSVLDPKTPDYADFRQSREVPNCINLGKLYAIIK